MDHLDHFVVGYCSSKAAGRSCNYIGQNVLQCVFGPFEHGRKFVTAVHPNCYPAFRRGRVVSARLSRSPASSDCAFITACGP